MRYASDYTRNVETILVVHSFGEWPIYIYSSGAILSTNSWWNYPTDDTYGSTAAGWGGGTEGEKRGHLRVHPELVEQVELDVNAELYRGDEERHRQVHHLPGTEK